MNKIPTIFERDWNGDRSRVTDQTVDACAWVFAGEGRATRKYDGTCVMRSNDGWFARREVKAGVAAPNGFVAISTDPETGKTIGWEPIDQSPFARFHAEAAAAKPDWTWDTGTYELCGPKIQKNPEGFDQHTLVYHDDAETIDVPHRTYDGIRAALAAVPHEGIVFHHPDGRRAKIKARDYGLRR